MTNATTLEAWHELVSNRNPDGLDAILSDEAVFHSPVVHTPQAGKGITKRYLGAAFQVLMNDTFRYVREITGEHEAMLEFVVEIDSITVNGVDIITWNEDAQIVDFKVMIRPLKAIDVVRRSMMKALEAQTTNNGPGQKPANGA